MNEDLVRRLRLCTSLPTPPATAVRIIKLANDPATSLTQISDCIGTDPALAVKILKVANSPLYDTHRRSASNVRQAVTLLGTRTSITVALSFSIVRNLKGAGRNHLPAGFWTRSILAAFASRILAQRFGLDSDDLFLAGLLQDVGILALPAVMPELYSEMAASVSNHDELVQEERARIGAGHDEVGYWLLKRWNLPDYLANACLASHRAPPSVLAAEASMEACVAVSGLFADIFLANDVPQIIVKAGTMARDWLGMDTSAFGAVVREMADGMKELEELFDQPLIDPEEADALASEAKELIFIASLSRLGDLEEKSQRDALTGAHNRLYFNDVFSKEFAVSTRHGWPLTLAFIDIDHFKQVNDTYGHAAGDRALITVSRLIYSHIRNDDVFARYGGEEFVLLFSGTALEEALKVLYRIKDAVESCTHRTETGEGFSVTVSIGVTCHMCSGSQYASTEEMLRVADEALYQTKGMGRNQITVAPLHAFPLQL